MFTLHTKGLKETVTLKNLPTLRQTFIVGSLVIIAGYVLAPYFPILKWLPLLPAIGLMISGVFGFCPMVQILQAMPWNRKVE
jgi:hypothetical protein